MEPQPRFPRGASPTQKVRQVWTPEEDRILSSAVARETLHTGSISWHKVAIHLPGRNNKDCRKRWHYSLANTLRKGTWNKEEDAKLLEAVERYGFRWSKVAKVVGSRNGDQCWKRYFDALDPRIDKSPWTEAEDERLLLAVESNGRKWTEIVTKHFPNRTSLSAKNRYSILLRKQDVVLQPHLTTSPAHSPMMDDGSSTYTFAFDAPEMLPQQQPPWNTTASDMAYTWYSEEMLDSAAVASSCAAAGPDVDWTIIYPDGTTGVPCLETAHLNAFVDADFRLHLSRFPSPGLMSVDSFPGFEFGEGYGAGALTGAEGGGSQDMVDAGDSGSLEGGQGMVYYDMAYDYW